MASPVNACPRELAFCPVNIKKRCTRVRLHINSENEKHRRTLRTRSPHCLCGSRRRDSSTLVRLASHRRQPHWLESKVTEDLWRIPTQTMFWLSMSETWARI